MTSNRPLKSAALAKGLAELPGWGHRRGALVKDFTFPGFKEAMAFMVRVGFEAEAMNHHPEWTNVYNSVAVRLNTHAAGGRVSALDIELARRMDKIHGAATAKL